MTAQPLSRRTFLHGLGVTMALPVLEAMLPRGAAAAATAGRAPIRTAFFYVPNGVNMAEWTPKQFGADFQLPYSLEPLQAHKNDVLVLTGLAQDKGRANGDGAGDHARAASTWLTGAQPLKSESSRIRVGVSADQVMAEAIGRQTRFPSIELGIEPARQGGKCDSGYACAYSNNISWRSETTPSGAEVNPRLVFERLFAALNPRRASEGAARRERQRKSILDFVLDDARTLSAKVGGSDKQKLDEYLTAVREIEQRVEAAQRSVAAVQHSGAIEAYDVPEAIPESYEEHAKLMLDMVALAFQTDSTRIATCMLANEGSNRSYRNLSITRGHHELSHHQGNAENLRQLREINHFHMRQFAYLLGKLKGMPEGDGTVLDNTQILYGAALADGNRHEHENLPLILAGRGGGTIMTGRHMRYASETPMCNLLLTMMNKAGVAAQRHGDSTGVLRGLEG
ncbi:MAG: DUF1552 domain-containing protein [Chthoniobacteraceae bacterium]